MKLAVSIFLFFAIVNATSQRSPKSVYCIETAGYFGADVGPVVKVNTTDECHNLCNMTPSCVVWNSYHGKGPKSCHRHASGFVPSFTPDGVRGSLNCSTTGGENVNEDGFRYGGNVIANLSGTNDYECQKYCVHVKGCKYWYKFKGENEFCNLLESFTDKINDPIYVSGVITRYPEETSTTTAIPANTTTIPANTTTIPANTTTIPANTTTIPANTTTIPANTTTIPANTTTIPANTTVTVTDTTGAATIATSPSPSSVITLSSSSTTTKNLNVFNYLMITSIALYFCLVLKA